VTEKPFDVVVVGAHPDDVEIACGGTIASLARQGYRVGIIDLTDGEPTPRCPSPEVRKQEAAAAAEILGVAGRIILPLTNRRLMDGFEERVLLAKEFRRWRPRIVIGFGNKTPMASPDHYQAMQITDAAIFYSRLTKWDEQFDNLPPHVILKHLYFRLAFESADPTVASHSVSVDITKTLDIKMQAIACYQTQFPIEKSHVFDRVRGIAIAAGAAAGFGAAEVFDSPRPWGVTDLYRALIAE
jgi:LmbE family N-acetylglucosaminyl deacetylase